MKKTILSLACFLIFGCSQLQTAPAPAFHTELENGAVDVNKDGILEVTYIYPACLVNAPEKKQIKVQYNTADSKSSPGMLRTVGGIVISLIALILRNL